MKAKEREMQLKLEEERDAPKSKFNKVLTFFRGSMENEEVLISGIENRLHSKLNSFYHCR